MWSGTPAALVNNAGMNTKLRISAIATFAVCAVLASAANAQTPSTSSAAAKAPTITLAADQLIGPPVPGAKPKTYALVSAVGSQIQIVRQKFQTGTNTEPYERSQLAIPGQALNNSVLRGLDRAVGRVDPKAERVLLHVNIPPAEQLSQYDRASAATDALLVALKNLPIRQEWDEIIAVTPRYMQGSSDRLGTKLWGIGVFVQPLQSGAKNSAADRVDFSNTDDDVFTLGSDTAVDDTFVAPYAYLRFTVFDAKTMKVLRTLDRTDARKTAVKNCETTDLFKCFNPDQYATMIDTLAERTAGRGITGVQPRGGSVEIGETKRVP